MPIQEKEKNHSRKNDKKLVRIQNLPLIMEFWKITMNRTNFEWLKQNFDTNGQIKKNLLEYELRHPTFFVMFFVVCHTGYTAVCMRICLYGN